MAASPSGLLAWHFLVKWRAKRTVDKQSWSWYGPDQNGLSVVAESGSWSVLQVASTLWNPFLRDKFFPRWAPSFNSFLFSSMRLLRKPQLLEEFPVTVSVVDNWRKRHGCLLERLHSCRDGYSFTAIQPPAALLLWGPACATLSPWNYPWLPADVLSSLLNSWPSAALERLGQDHSLLLTFSCDLSKLTFSFFHSPLFPSKSLFTPWS